MASIYDELLFQAELDRRRRLAGFLDPNTGRIRRELYGNRKPLIPENELINTALAQGRTARHEMQGQRMLTDEAVRQAQYGTTDIERALYEPEGSQGITGLEEIGQTGARRPRVGAGGRGSEIASALGSLSGEQAAD